mgnify:CR=1 FL=1
MDDQSLLPFVTESKTGYSKALDEVRLKGQQGRIINVLKDGKFRTLREISQAANPAPEASVSAQLRLFKRPLANGGFGWQMNKQRRGDPTRGIWEYQVLIPE